MTNTKLTKTQILEAIAEMYPGMGLEKAVTCMKEDAVAERLNAVIDGADYAPSTNSGLPGVDLIDKNGVHPPVQVKTSEWAMTTKSFPLAGGKLTVQKISEKATNVHPDALLAVVWMDGARIDHLLYGRADALANYTTSTGNPAKSIRNARKSLPVIGFTQA